MYFSGFRGSMELTDSLLKIDRKGEGEHSIPLSQIVSVIVMKPGLTSNGLIHIQTVASQGTSASKNKDRIWHGYEYCIFYEIFISRSIIF